MADQIYYLDVEGQKVPIKIIEERRDGARVALGGKHIILRVPKSLFSQTNINKHIDWAHNWLKQLKAKKPNLLDRYSNLKFYKDEDIFVIGGLSFFLEINKSDRETGKIKLLNEGVLKIDIPDGDNYDEQKLIKSLLIKFSQKYFHSEISDRVRYYNDKYFKKQINNVRLKYNKSNWGSCSTGKNLNFSVRLFFAPKNVIDYVVIHELSHLVEMNHSDRFWKIVGDIMPDYVEMEKNLKLNSSKYDF